MVLAAVEIAVVVSLACNTAVVAVACGGHRGVVFKIVKSGVVAVTYNTAGVAAAINGAAEREVVYLGFVVLACTQHITEQAAVVGRTCNGKAAYGVSATVEMAFKRCGAALTYHAPVGETGEVEVVDHEEVPASEVHTLVGVDGEGVQSVGRAYQIGVELCAGAAAELRFGNDTYVLYHILHRTR